MSETFFIIIEATGNTKSLLAKAQGTHLYLWRHLQTIVSFDKKNEIPRHKWMAWPKSCSYLVISANLWLYPWILWSQLSLLKCTAVSWTRLHYLIWGPCLKIYPICLHSLGSTTISSFFLEGGPGLSKTFGKIYLVLLYQALSLFRILPFHWLVPTSGVFSPITNKPDLLPSFPLVPSKHQARCSGWAWAVSINWDPYKYTAKPVWITVSLLKESPQMSNISFYL